jgi:hypothetical protein
MSYVALKRVALVCFVLLAGCANLPSQGYVARNGLLVYDRADGAFEVLARPGTAGIGYFCAAGEFARVMRNAGATDRVVIVRGDGPSGAIPGGRSVVFSIGPPGPSTQPVVSTAPMRRAGASLSVATAQSLCRSGTNNPHTIS